MTKKKWILGGPVPRMTIWIPDQARNDTQEILRFAQDEENTKFFSNP